MAAEVLCLIPLLSSRFIHTSSYQAPPLFIHIIHLKLHCKFSRQNYLVNVIWLISIGFTVNHTNTTRYWGQSSSCPICITYFQCADPTIKYPLLSLNPDSISHTSSLSHFLLIYNKSHFTPHIRFTDPNVLWPRFPPCPEHGHPQPDRFSGKFCTLQRAGALIDIFSFSTLPVCRIFFPELLRGWMAVVVASASLLIWDTLLTMDHQVSQLSTLMPSTHELIIGIKSLVEKAIIWEDPIHDSQYFLLFPVIFGPHMATLQNRYVPIVLMIFNIICVFCLAPFTYVVHIATDHFSRSPSITVCFMCSSKIDEPLIWISVVCIYISFAGSM